MAAIIDMNRGAVDRADERSDEALRLFERVGDARGTAGVLDVVAMTTFLEGRIAEAVGLFDRVARLFLDVGNLLRAYTPRSARGHGLVFMARRAEGLADVEEALDLVRAVGHPEGEAYCLWHRSHALAVLDRAEGLPHFASWAAARLSHLLVASGREEVAEPFARRALAEGTGLSHFEARLARADLAAARGDADARRVAEEALRLRGERSPLECGAAASARGRCVTARQEGKIVAHENFFDQLSFQVRLGFAEPAPSS